MCPIGFLMLSSTLQDLPSDSPAACRAACRRRRASLPTGSHQRTILACTRPILVGHAVELATAPTTSHNDDQVQTDASAGPAPPAPASSTRLPTQADHEPVMDAAGDHADPGHPSRTAAAPPPRSRTSLRPDTVDAATHRQRTPERSDARTGHRTPVPWTGKRGHWSLAPDTGHWPRTWTG